MSKAAAVLPDTLGYMGPGSRFFASGTKDCTHEWDMTTRKRVCGEDYLAPCLRCAIESVTSVLPPIIAIYCDGPTHGACAIQHCLRTGDLIKKIAHLNVGGRHRACAEGTLAASQLIDKSIPLARLLKIKHIAAAGVSC
eukprot:2380664-Pleurochrysis_carterae.AAC.1